MIKDEKNYRLAFGYLRVSSDEQKKRGFSIEEQEEEILRWASNNKVRIVRFFIDKAYSAGTVNRPDFQNMLNELSKVDNKVHLIVSRDSARIVRNIVLKKSIKRFFEKLKIELIYLHAFVDDSTPEGTMASDIYAVMDETELKRVSPRTLKGLRGSALLGNYPCGGPQCPRGYMKVANEKAGKGSKLVVCGEEKDWIIKIFTMMTTNRVTREQMIKYLRKNKVFGLVWDRRSLDAIMDNTIYYGRLKTSYFDSEEVIDEKYRAYWYSPEYHTQPIISKELWETANHAYHHYKKSMKHKYIFARLVYCIDTNEWMRSEPAWKKRKNDKILYKYYIDDKCNKRINERKVTEKFAAEYSIYQLNEIDSKIRKGLVDLLKNKYRRRDILDEDFDNGFIEEADYREQMKNINISIQETKSKINNLEMTSNNFLELPFDKQRAIVLSHVQRVNISFINETITFTFIK